MVSGLSRHGFWPVWYWWLSGWFLPSFWFSCWVFGSAYCVVTGIATCLFVFSILVWILLCSLLQYVLSPWLIVFADLELRKMSLTKAKHSIFLTQIFLNVRYCPGFALFVLWFKIWEIHDWDYSVMYCLHALHRRHGLLYLLSPAFPISVDPLSRVPEEYVGRRNLECVEALQENPLNPRQVLIGYSRGLMVLWDLDRRCAIQHFLGTQVFL